MSRWSRGLLAACLCWLLLGWPLLGWAGGLESLRQFLSDTRTLKADFSQLVVGKNGRKGQTAYGTLAIARPGKLRWEINKPYPQLMVSDGSKFWMYDPELKQVTVKRVSQALGSTPAALLSGGADFERNFRLQEAGEAEGMQWVEAIPKEQDSGFERLRLGFSNGELRAMELLDNFGQTTHVRLSHLERNPALPAGQFRFTPPPGADVVGE